MKLLFKSLFFLLFIINVNAAEIDLKKILPMDPKITYGKLDNGVTYYIKNNQLPKNTECPGWSFCLLYKLSHCQYNLIYAKAYSGQLY
jgi:hypothetical protein